MRKLAVLISALVAATAFPALGQQPAAGRESIMEAAPGKGAIANVVKITASVEAIDSANRTLTLKGPRGKVVILPVTQEVRNFDQIKPGDFVVVRYLEALSLELKKGGTAVRERVETETGGRAQPGERPAAGSVRQVHVTADVIGLNPKTQTVTLRGPQRIVDLKVRDPNQFRLVKVGDQVEATFTEAVAISVEPAPKPAATKK